MSKPDKSLNCSGDNFFAEIFHDKSLWRYSDASLVKDVYTNRRRSRA